MCSTHCHDWLSTHGDDWFSTHWQDRFSTELDARFSTQKIKRFSGNGNDKGQLIGLRGFQLIGIQLICMTSIPTYNGGQTHQVVHNFKLKGIQVLSTYKIWQAF